MTLKRFAHAVVLAYGFRRFAIAFTAGAVSVLAMAPFNIWPVLFVTLPVCVWLLDGAAAGRSGPVTTAALTGWWFGFGFFLAGLYWIGNAFLVDAQIFGWLLPFAVAGLPAGLAFFMAAGFALARVLWTRDATRILSLAVALTATEWLRGHVLTGFPWNALGYALSTPQIMAQSASVIGLWGLTFLAVAVFASPAVLTDDEATTRQRWTPPIMALGVLAIMAAFGAQRVLTTDIGTVEGVKLRIMQPNLQQDVKFNYGAKAEVMRKYLALSDRDTGPQTRGVRDATILIWPESAFPFFLAREPDALAQIAELLPMGTMLITGAVRPPTGAPSGPVTRAYNSVYVIDHDGTIAATYDKLHLVPFGEYLPFQSALEKLGLMQLTKVQGGFIPGDRRRTISLPRAPRVLPLICYEVIFPGQAVSRDDRPGWIVNLTNDGWFGISPGPYQHLQQARLRAIEEGLPIVRAANTGISAVIDPLGRITMQLALGTEGVLDAALPQALPLTLYTRFGDFPLAALMIVCTLVVWRRRKISRKL
jgi:apolipoprotein N-acyltransferase